MMQVEPAMPSSIALSRARQMITSAPTHVARTTSADPHYQVRRHVACNCARR